MFMLITAFNLLDRSPLNKNECARGVSGITFIRFAQNQKIGKPIYLRFGSNKTNGPKT